MGVPNGSTVRWFHSDMPGAPQNNALAGDYIAILDACLVNGFDQKNVDSLVVASDVATVTIDGGHDYEKHAVIRIAGATPAELNGDWRIATADATTFTFATTGIADGAATGTITAIRATPGYWEKSFSGTNKAAYRSIHEDASGCYFRIDDNPTGHAPILIRAYEAMTDVDTGTRPFPTFAQLAENSYQWRKLSTTSSAVLPRPWIIVADESFFWFFSAFLSTDSHNDRKVSYFFGDIARFNPADVYACVVGGHGTASTHTSHRPDSLFDAILVDGSATGCYFARNSANEAVDPVSFRRYGNARSPRLGGGSAFPDPVTQGYAFHYPILSADDGIHYRGFTPGILQSLTHDSLTLDGDEYRVLDPSEAFTRAILLLGLGWTTASRAHVGVDIFGPWR